MAKIQFTLDAWLKDKSQKVETRDGRLVHNIWRVKEPSYTNNRKTEVCALIDGEEDALVFFEGGRYLPSTKDTDSPFDLFIVTLEEELTEFEKELESFYNHHLQVCTYDNQGTVEESLHDGASKLLALAKKEIVAGWSNGLNDTQDRSGKAYSDGYNIGFEIGYERGKAEAMRGLPMWIDDGLPMGSAAIDISGLCGFNFIRRRGRLFRISDLEKLPGFND